ncbi:MarR family transcriptional regulator, partial [Mycobacterium tuberculosis]
MGLADDAPLGYLLYRVGAVLRPEVSAALSPLGLTLPEFVCLRMLSQAPGLASPQVPRPQSVQPQAVHTGLHK